MNVQWHPFQWDNLWTGALSLQWDDKAVWSIPTMLGCPIQCTFCVSSKEPYTRALTAHELVSMTNQLHSVTPVEWSLTGEGEPALNIQAIEEAAWALQKHPLIHRARVCFSGLKSERLLDLHLPWPVRWQCSLHAARDSVRRALIPHTIDTHLLMERCHQFSARGEMVDINVVLQAGRNDQEEDLTALLDLVRGTNWCVVLNPHMTDNQLMIHPHVQRWSAVLRDAGVKTLVSEVVGKKIVSQRIYPQMTAQRPVTNQITRLAA